MNVTTLSDDPQLVDVINEIHSEPWPAFLSEDEVIKKYWRRLYEVYPQYQFVFKDGPDYVGLANCSPIHWNGTPANLPPGFREAVEVIVRSEHTADCLCALAIVVRKEYSGKGISSGILKEVKAAGYRHGLTKLIVPVRPTLKSSYPLVPMEDYMHWKTSGLPFDPWLKVHVRSGGKILREADRSIIVRGTVAQWQEWTGMYFGSSGDYVVEGALNPVRIDLENDVGEYVEPNVWVSHKCGA